MSVVFWKELADHFSSRRFMILLIIIILSGFWATYATGQAIRQNTDTVPYNTFSCFCSHRAARRCSHWRRFLGFSDPWSALRWGLTASAASTPAARSAGCSRNRSTATA